MTRTRKIRSPRSPRPATKEQFHILVASSGDRTSDGAIRVAGSIALAKHASVEVVTVATPFPHSAPSAFQVAPPPVIDATARSEAIARVREQLARLGVDEGWPVAASLGWPASRIANAASRWPASLLVVGLGEHGVLDRLLGSETAVKLAHHVAMPVLAVPEDAHGAPTHALVAIDFASTSVDAALEAAKLVGPNGVITLAHASVLVAESSPPGSFGDVFTAGVVEKLRAIRDQLQLSAGCRVDAVALPGEIVPSLLAYAESHHCDLIAVGGQERAFVERLLVGSIRSKVLRHARQAVLVVAPSEASQPS